MKSKVLDEMSGILIKDTPKIQKALHSMETMRDFE
jgi:hypothetical protein